MIQPISANGAENLMTLLSKEMIAGRRMITKGYMAIRWYQQRIHGGNPMISLKNKLPMVASKATSQVKNIRVNFLSVMALIL